MTICVCVVCILNVKKQRWHQALFFSADCYYKERKKSAGLKKPPTFVLCLLSHYKRAGFGQIIHILCLLEKFFSFCWNKLVDVPSLITHEPPFGSSIFSAQALVVVVSSCGPTREFQHLNPQNIPLSDLSSVCPREKLS